MAIPVHRPGHRFVSLVLATVLASLSIVMGCGSGTGPAPSTADQANSELPELELARLGDDGVYRVDGPGQNRVLNLWATWCAPCRAELPAFDAVATQRPDLEFVGVNVGDSGEAAQELIAELGVAFAQVLDPTAQIQRALRITVMPSTIFVDESGAILDIHNGDLTEVELTELLAQLYPGSGE